MFSFSLASSFVLSDPMDPTPLSNDELRADTAGQLGWVDLRKRGVDYAAVVAGLGRLGLRPPRASLDGPNLAARERGMTMLRSCFEESPNARVIVRAFEAADADPVDAMIGELAALHGENALVTSPNIIRFASGRHRISSLWVAIRSGKLCGFAATYDWMNYVHGFPIRNIDLILVRHGARGCGVGRGLLGFIARDAKACSCRRLTVGTEPDNEGANSFYVAMGFELRQAKAKRYAMSGSAFDRLAAA